MKKEWRPVVGNHRYEVSDQGDVRSLYNFSRWNRAGKLLADPKYIAPQQGRFGYVKVNLYLDGRMKSWTLHRLVAMAFLAPIQGATQVNHINGVKGDNRLVNLEYVTRSQNMRHAHANGLMHLPRGDRHFNTKVTAGEAAEIAELHSRGVFQRELAVAFGMSQPAVSRLLGGKVELGKALVKSV